MLKKVNEIYSEIQSVVVGDTQLLDIVVPPILFLILVNVFGFTAAVWGALSLAIAILCWRLVRRQSVKTAVGGVLGVLVAIAVASLLDSEEGFFVPGILISLGTGLVAAITALFGRPMVAWTSYLSRRWPLPWYWHPKVRPAYSEVTWLWAVYFLLRFLLQLNLFQTQQAGQLAGANLLLGWPATLLLLIVSYLYGTWRLRNLGGPSVEEFEQNIEPPWQGQQRGF